MILNSLNNENKTKVILLSLNKMLNSWGVGYQDWIIENRLFFKDYYFLKNNKFNQFQILIKDSKIPWEVEFVNQEQLIPPYGSEFFKEYAKFVKKYARIEIYSLPADKFDIYRKECDLINIKNVLFQQLNIYQQIKNEWNFTYQRKTYYYGSYIGVIKKILESAKLNKDEKMLRVLSEINDSRNIKKQIPVKIMNLNTNLIGEIKFLFDKEDAVLKNHILLINKVTLDLLPYFINVKATIAPVNSYTSHVAVIFREIKKPLIYSNINFYKYFFEGDVVEVDSDNSVLKIIKPVKF